MEPTEYFTEELRQDAVLQGYLSGLILCALSNATDTEHYQTLLKAAEDRIAEHKEHFQIFNDNNRVDTAKPC